MRRAWRPAALFLLGLLAGYFFAYARMQSQGHVIEPGSAIVERDENSVLFLSYATKAMRVTAQRSRPGISFAIQATYADGRPVEICRGSADLAKHLVYFTDLVAKREMSLERRGDDFPVQMGVLDIRDLIIGEPEGPMLVFTNKAENSVATIVDGHAVELTVPLSAFRTLEKGCAALKMK